MVRYCIQFSWYLYNLVIDSIMAMIAPNSPTTKAITEDLSEYADINGIEDARIISTIWNPLYILWQCFDFLLYHCISLSTRFIMYSSIFMFFHLLSYLLHRGGFVSRNSFTPHAIMIKSSGGK